MYTIFAPVAIPQIGARDAARYVMKRECKKICRDTTTFHLCQPSPPPGAADYKHCKLMHLWFTGDAGWEQFYPDACCVFIFTYVAFFFPPRGVMLVDSLNEHSVWLDIRRC